MTEHDLIKRYDNSELKKDFNEFDIDNPFVKALNLVNSMVLILNHTRQIVFANMEIIHRLGYTNLTDVLGKRPGEIVKCIHSDQGIAGCGTSEKCENCNSLNVVLRTIQSGGRVVDLVRVIRKKNEKIKHIDMEILADIYEVDSREYIIVNFTDMYENIRKLEMERIFYHDILNSAGGIKGILQLMSEDAPSDFFENFEFVKLAFKELVEIIEVQRKISFLKNDVMDVKVETVNSIEVINNLKQFFVKMDEKHKGKVVIDLESVDIDFKTDEVILKRILHNMIKNGLEAITKIEVVTIGCNIQKGKYIEFWVRNPGYIDEYKRRDIFNKRFSTKGNNRGWGTFSMKILGESFLDGNVDYETDKVNGTKFYLRIPTTFEEELQ